MVAKTCQMISEQEPELFMKVCINRQGPVTIFIVIVSGKGNWSGIRNVLYLVIPVGGLNFAVIYF